MLVQHCSVPCFSFLKDLFLSWDIWRFFEDLFHELLGPRNVCFRSKGQFVLCLVFEVRMSKHLWKHLIWLELIMQKSLDILWSNPKLMLFQGYLTNDYKPKKWTKLRYKLSLLGFSCCCYFVSHYSIYLILKLDLFYWVIVVKHLWNFKQ